MCCDHDLLDLPTAVRTMLGGYRDMRAGRPADWGDDWSGNTFAGLALPSWLPVPLTAHLLGRPELLEVAAGERTLDEAIAACIAGTDVRGLAVVEVSDDAIDATPAEGLPRVIAGSTAHIDLIVRSASRDATSVRFGDWSEQVPAGGTRLLAWDLDAALPEGSGTGTVDVRIRDTAVAVALVLPASRLHLRSPRPVRWSVVDSSGGGWFPEGAPPKWDDRQRPFFHAASCTLTVPAGRVSVMATNGIGSRPATQEVEAGAGDDVTVEMEPGRRFDPRASGWYGADVHVHANLSGDLVISPEEAVCMQAGEDLDLLNLVASNLSRQFVYDREAFESTAGRDLPSADAGRVTRFGAEYRNDLLGHISALGITSPPSRYQTGHEPEAGQEDWPPNATMLSELRDRDALVSYCHPVWSPLSADDPVEPFEGEPRSVEARELVADAALGLVDAVELISNADPEGTIGLYHRLLDCGLRLAAVAGTDSFLSVSHGLNSDPPGWARVYAHLGSLPLSVEAFAASIRRGATLATNGPWLTLDVDELGPGALLDAPFGTRVTLRASAMGPGVRHVVIVSADGELARSAAASDDGADGQGDPREVSVTADVRLDAPTWVAARVVGDPHPEVLGHPAVAHTTPVYVDIAGERVARADSARWCLRWLDHTERLVRDHGRYQADAHRDDVLGIIDAARAIYRGVESRGLSRAVARG